MSDATAPEWLDLDADEEVVWTGRPAMASIASELVVGVALLPLFGLGLLVMVPAYLRVQNTEYVATTKALYERTGVLSESITSVGLDKIQNTEYSQSFVEKQLGYGSVGVSTAGSAGVELVFEAIEDARDVQGRVNELSNRYRERREAAEDAPPGADPLDAIREELAATREALEAVERALREERGDAAGRSADAPAEDGTDSDDRGDDRPEDGGGLADRRDGPDEDGRGPGGGEESKTR